MPLDVARRNQAIAEVDRLIRDFNHWKNLRQESPAPESPLGPAIPAGVTHKYDSQLEGLSTEVLGAAGILRCHLTNLAFNLSMGELYAECARTEEESLWLWRVWDYFREKFDQRVDERYSEALLAADEVVWSCYRPFFRTLIGGRVPEPAPLPYIEADFAPSALRSDQKEVLARRGSNFKLLSEAFQKLPIPILKVPVTTVSNPWTLVLIGHETGHIVQPAVAPDFANKFGAAISAAVPGEDQEYWSDWSREIFADWYAVATMGQWALWALAQFEQGEPPPSSRGALNTRRR